MKPTKGSEIKLNTYEIGVLQYNPVIFFFSGFTSFWDCVLLVVLGTMCENDEIGQVSYLHEFITVLMHWAY